MIRISETIKQARKRRGLSQAELANRCHVSRAAISNMEIGRDQVPSLQKIRDICEALNISSLRFIGDMELAHICEAYVGADNGKRKQIRAILGVKE